MYLAFRLFRLMHCVALFGGIPTQQLALTIVGLCIAAGKDNLHIGFCDVNVHMWKF